MVQEYPLIIIIYFQFKECGKIPCKSSFLTKIYFSLKSTVLFYTFWSSGQQAGKVLRYLYMALWWETFSISVPLPPLHAKHFVSLCTIGLIQIFCFYISLEKVGSLLIVKLREATPPPLVYRMSLKKFAVTTCSFLETK